jgi:hypothetical protein
VCVLAKAMVLDRPDRIEAHRVGELDLRDAVMKELLFRRPRGVGDLHLVKQREPHHVPPIRPGRVAVSAINDFCTNCVPS